MIPRATKKSTTVALGEDDSAWNLVDLQAWNHGRWGGCNKMSICSCFPCQIFGSSPLIPLASPFQIGGLSKCNSLKVTPLAEVLSFALCCIQTYLSSRRCRTNDAAIAFRQMINTALCTENLEERSAILISKER